MTDIWMWRENVYADGPERLEQSTMQSRDVTGFDVEAQDGKIGTVDAATYETGASSLVVDTGFWIFGKKRELPAGVVQRVDVEDRKVYVSCTKQQIKDAPDYDPDLRTDEYRAGLTGHYRI